MDENSILKAVNLITCDSLTCDEQTGLAKLLRAYHGMTPEDGVLRQNAHDAYSGAVDFLWLSNRIGHTQKMDLLDLV